jgi:tripartite-type tricarboxylate transporter receptor subunit TctC
MRLIALLLAILVAAPAAAQEYPARTIRIVVPFLAGGGTDILARVIAQKLNERWGQGVVVDNRPGGNTLIGAQEVARAAPDGYTLLMAIDSTLVMNQYLYSKLPYDPVKDFTPVTITALSQIAIFVDGATGPKTVQELIQAAKADPAKWNYAAATITTQLGGELFKRAIGAPMTLVPYKGSAGNLQALLAGDVPLAFDGVTAYVPYVKSGKLRALANMSGTPVAVFPDLPRLADMPGFPGFDVTVWLGLVAPAGTPAPIVAKLHQEVARINSLPEVKERLAASGLDPRASESPAEFGAYLKRESARWSTVIKESGMKFD